MTKAEDIPEIILPGALERQLKMPLGDNAAQAKIINPLAHGLRDGEELQRASALEVSVFSSELTMLEINGVIRPLGANQ